MTTLTSSSEISLAKEWLLNSGIQDLKGAERGGFNSWFDLDSGEYSYVYPEVTGYGITALLFLNDLFGGNFVERARLAAKWLEEKALHPCGGVRTGKNENIYAFDSGMVLYGLLNLYKTSGERQYLGFAEKIASFLLKDMRKGDSLFYAVYDPKTGEKKDAGRKWSDQSGSYHARIVLGLTSFHDITHDEAYKDAALTLCEKCLAFQESSGRFITSTADNSTHLHPHAYSAEGLLYAGMYFGREDFIRASEKAVLWALEGQCRDGNIPKAFDGKRFIAYYRTDILAQILRLGVILRAMGRLDGDFSRSLRRLRNRLLTFQYLGNDSQKGGFYYGFTLDGQRKKHINSWCSMFALQALIMYEELYGKNKNIIGSWYFI